MAGRRDPVAEEVGGETLLARNRQQFLPGRLDFLEDVNEMPLHARAFNAALARDEPDSGSLPNLATCRRATYISLCRRKVSDKSCRALNGFRRQTIPAKSEA